MAGKEYREVRKRLGNEPADSSPYVLYARALLGELKEDMARQNLQQGVRRRSIACEHGEGQVEVSSIFGKDEIRIIVPTGGKDEPVKKKVEEELMPYLWVGYRRNNELSGELTSDWIVTVSEPGENGIIQDNPSYYAWGPWAGYLGPETFSKQAQDAAWDANNYHRDVPINRRQYYIETARGNHHAFTANLLRHFVVSYDPAPAEDDPVQLPYDPLAEEGDLGGRTFPDWWWEGERKWDRVTVLDPMHWLPPTDKREADVNTVKILSEKLELGGARGRVLPGEYAIKICGSGEDCRWGENAPRWDEIWDNTDPNSAWRTAIFNEYRTGYYDPLVIDIEVRVLKYPNMITKSFQCTLLNATYYQRNIWPFGDKYSEQFECPGFAGDGLNHHHKNWWQDCILVNPLSGSIRLAPNYAPPNYMEEGGDPFASCKRAKWKILVMLYAAYYPAGIDDWITTNIAEQIEYLVVRGASGLYGALSTPEQYAPQIKAAIAGRLEYGLSMYDVSSMTLTKLPDWDIDYPDPNPLHEAPTEPMWGSFEDYYRIQEMRAGRGIGIVAYGFGAARYIGWHYNGDPDGMWCAPIDSDCCDIP